MARMNPPARRTPVKRALAALAHSQPTADKVGQTRFGAGRTDIARARSRVVGRADSEAAQGGGETAAAERVPNAMVSARDERAEPSAERGDGGKRPVRLAIVDDDPMVRTGLRLLFGGPDSGIEVVAEAADGAEAITVASAHWPDVMLMDIRMPRVDGVQATKQIRRQPGAPQILALTTFNVDEYVVEALRNGASGFLLKDTPPEDLIAAVHAAAAGECVLSPQVLRPVVDFIAGTAAGSRRAEARKQLAKLTDRERAVAVGLGHGWSNAEIGAELKMGVSTVKGHVSRVLGKLCMTNRAQAAVLVHEAGLV